jgi:uncharacterized protein (DUF1810 family)
MSDPLGDAQDKPFDLQRFVDAQAGGVYERALAELRAGPFDKLRTGRNAATGCGSSFHNRLSLGGAGRRSITACQARRRARAYLVHPLLGPRYRECVAAVPAWVNAGRSLEAIFC